MSRAEDTDQPEGPIPFNKVRGLGKNRPSLESIDGIGGGGGGMDGIPERIAKVEADVGHIATDVGQIKKDLRWLLMLGIAATAVLAGGMITSYLLLAGQQEGTRRELSELIRYEVGRISPPPSN